MKKHIAGHAYSAAKVIALAVVTLSASAALAQNLEVIPVPWNALDLAIPHQAYNGHATTFKAIARGGNGTYDVEWDFDGDGAFEPVVTTTSRYNLSATFTYPNQATTRTFQAVVRVKSNGETVAAAYPVRVFADVPSDPAAATDRQLQVMRGVAVDDGLWNLHNQIVRSGNEADPLTGAQITGNLGGNTTATAAGFLWSLALNGHYAAFPAAYLGDMPDAAVNAARWSTDPYAEDAVRLVNYLLINATVVSVAAADEVNLVGFYPEVLKTPIPGTDDLIGLYIGSSPGDQTSYYMGHALSALSAARLGGYVAQVGDWNRILGRRMEFVLQQLVDGLVWAQNDGGSYPGSWYYSPNANADDLSTTLWAMTGLWHAERFAAADGVIVPNLVKARLVNFIGQNRESCPEGGFGGTYTTEYSGVCDQTLTAAHVLALGWVGANTFTTTDSRIAFPSYNGLTRGMLRTWYNGNLTYIANTFSGTTSTGTGWNRGFVEGGDFGRTDGHGNHYGMLHWQDAARAVKPALVTFGASDWSRSFSRYLVNNQAAAGNWTWAASTPLGNNSDSNGGDALRSAWAILTLSPDDFPPLAIAEANALFGDEGDTFYFSGAGSDPGSGNPSYHWDFGNGDALDGQDVAYTFRDNGVFNVTLTATSGGESSTDGLVIAVGNLPPVVSVGPNLSALEGAPVTFGASVADPGVADTFTYKWDFDGTNTFTSTATAPSFTYSDNGTYTVTLTVTDDDLGIGSDTLSVTVANVAPTMTGTPGTAALEGTPYSFTATYSDPGAADTFTCELPQGPAGMTLTGCTVDWIPDFGQALGASTPVELCVRDNAGDLGCQSWSIAVSFADTDNDDLPDTWENRYFGGIVAQDGFGDPDGDGLNNLQELNGLTDPTLYDGPSIPSVSSPACGSELATTSPALVLANATDPQGTIPSYEIELFADSGLTALLDKVTAYPQGGGATTSWTPSAVLVENANYFWRARARDPYVSGGWSAVCSFMVNAANESPSAPRLNAPAIAGHVASFTPSLVVDDATDPDHDALTYAYEVYTDPRLSVLVASAAAVADSAGPTSSWTLDVTLLEDHWYWWRAQASDQHGATSDWTATGSFFVSTANAAPEAPILLLPQNATSIADLSPTLIILNADDPDLDLLTYDFELAADSTFSTLLASDTGVFAQGANTTGWRPSVTLDEDGHYCWRARASDGATTSGWAAACFLVSAANGAPSVPTLMNPSDQSVVTVMHPLFSWVASTDPEGGVVFYTLELYDNATQSGAPVDAAAMISGTNAMLPFDLAHASTYYWRVRAADASGATSAWSSVNQMTVHLSSYQGNGTDVDLDGLPDAWEMVTFGSLTAADQFGDIDHDGMNTLQEYINQTNPLVYDGPSAAAAAAPSCGATVTSLNATVTVTNAADPQGTPLTYTFELYADMALTQQVERVTGRSEDPSGATTWTFAAVLEENHTYYWRARASDPYVDGAWSGACGLLVSATNEAPSVPEPSRPFAGSVVGVALPTLAWFASVDPEAHAVTYEVEVFEGQEATGTAVFTATDLAATTVTMSVALTDGTAVWRVRAHDELGAASEWSAPVVFKVTANEAVANAPPVTGGVERGGCGCRAGGAGSLGGWSALVGLLVLARLRRWRQREGVEPA